MLVSFGFPSGFKKESNFICMYGVKFLGFRVDYPGGFSLPTATFSCAPPYYLSFRSVDQRRLA